MSNNITTNALYTALNPDIHKEIDKLIETLKQATNHLSTEKSIEELISTQCEKIESGEINQSFMNDLYFATVKPSSQGKEKAAIHLAFNYIALAQICSEAGSTTKAWSAASNANYYLGLLNGLHLQSTGKIEKETPRAQKRASAGGTKKSENQEAIKALLAKELCTINKSLNLTTLRSAAEWLSEKLSKELQSTGILKNKTQNEISNIFEQIIANDIVIENVFWTRKDASS